MPTAVENILSQLEKVNEASTETELRALVQSINQNSAEPPLRDAFQKLAGRSGKEIACQLNVLSAGFFGALPGDTSLAPEGGKVNRFLHKLRKAIMATTGLAKKMKENATLYNFYPEFASQNPGLRQRIVAIAKAHVDMGKSSEELTVLYSLAGYFSEAEAKLWNNGIGSRGGTTCVMTARAVYQAAGANMIGQRVPAVNTPSGPEIDLGVPTVKTSAASNRKFADPTIRRDGISKEDTSAKPRFQAGDIYMVEGDANHQFLLRGNGSLAVHVGIIIDIRGDEVDTVDGGQGAGGSVGADYKRKLEHGESGWTFSDSARSYGKSDFTEIEKAMKVYNTEGKIDAYIATIPFMRDRMNQMKQDYQKQLDAGNSARAMMILNELNVQRDRALSLLRQAAAGPLGAKRIIHGWWKPERYGVSTLVTVAMLKNWLSNTAGAAQPGGVGKAA